jgi:hypothetical protein
MATPVAVLAPPVIVNTAAPAAVARTVGAVPSVTLPNAKGVAVTVTAAVTLAETLAVVDAVPENDNADIAHIKMATKRIFFMILLLFMMLID